jgi:DNA 3'-phosphatase
MENQSGAPGNDERGTKQPKDPTASTLTTANPSDDKRVEEPVPKKAKVDGNPSSTSQQSSLLNFFSSSKVPKKQGTSTKDPPTPSKSAAKPTKQDDPASNNTKESANDDEDDDDTDPIVPKQTPTPSNVRWESLHNQHVIARIPRLAGNPVHTKVAAFDLDGTLVKWSNESPGFWPSRLEHYELWNKSVISKLQSLYDHDGYLLVVFTNQGGIQKAHGGKRATLVKNLLDWMASLIDRPLCAVASTRSLKKASDTSFHKPLPHMWNKVLASKTFGQGSGGLDKSVPDCYYYDLSSSFFVGDSAEEDDSQGGVDRKFAANVGIQFYTPEEYFGPSSKELRQRSQQVDSGSAANVPPEAIQARKALLGGYLQGPILLILAGVQGSGKSTFCRQLVGDDNDDDDAKINGNPQWIWLSQDTINNGKPGKREKVEDEARKAIQQGNSVIIDRMHLDPEQRKYFVNVAKECKVPAHVVLLNPPKEVVSERVKNRTNHPGKVEGENGAKLAVASMSRLVMPSYDEGVDLVSCAATEFAACQLALRYQTIISPETTILIQDKIPLSSSVSIPTISLGTMGIGRRSGTETVSNMLNAGFQSIDTAPTYKNEDKVGEALQAKRNDTFVMAKIPKRAATADEVGEELDATLDKLQTKSVDLLLLHWPSDVIVGNTLKEVWQSMEQCVKDGKCKSLGVCNFNQGALSQLLKICSIPPVINQIERHPLLSQTDLVDFCARNNIVLQAHTPLGQGSEKVLGNETVRRISQEASLTPAQVVILWNLQQGVLVVPKCTQESHAKELLSLLSGEKRLSPEQMKAMDGLDNGTRLVAPPFMYGTNVYCWGERMPSYK